MLRRTRWTVGHSLQALCRQEGLPQWASGERIRLRCRRHRFNPWVGNTPWRRAWQLTRAVWLAESQSRGAWCTKVHGVAKSCTRLEAAELKHKSTGKRKEAAPVLQTRHGGASGTLWFNFGFTLC